MATIISAIPDSQVNISGKRMRDIRPVCKLIFKDSFKTITINRDKMKFEIWLIDADDAIVKDFKKEYPMCLIEITYSKK